MAGPCHVVGGPAVLPGDAGGVVVTLFSGMFFYLFPCTQ